MSGMHQFWSTYEDKNCSGVPTGVYMKRINDCPSPASGNDCTAKFANGELIGYVEVSCHVGRAAGLKNLYNGTPFMAYDYYYDNDCTETYDNSASYQLIGECGPLYNEDEFYPFRSATVLVMNGNLSWTRNMGTTNESLNCPGPTGPNYDHFNMPLDDVNDGTCKNFNGVKGGFVFYNTSLSQPLTDSTDSGLRGGVIGGVAGAGVGVLLVIVTLICCFWRRKRMLSIGGAASTTPLEDPFLRRGSAWTSGPTPDSDPLTLESGLWRSNIIIAHRVPRDQVIVEELISRGGFGEIYRGTYNRENVAIKMLFPEMRSDLHKVNGFLMEAKIMASLTHPHIVRFVGVSWGSLSDLCVLTELMEGGDLRELLKGYDANGHPQGIDQEKLRIAYHVAQALTYLHSLSPIVIHRDLKSKNVLLTENLDAKLTDFGVSREQQEDTMTAGVGTMLWMAPEVMMAEHYDEKADIFSFGVLLSELDLQMLPYSHAKYDSETGMKVPDTVILQKVASGLLQVEFSGGCLASVAELGRECVTLDAKARPSSPMLIFRLQTIMKDSFGA